MGKVHPPAAVESQPPLHRSSAAGLFCSVLIPELPAILSLRSVERSGQFCDIVHLI